MQVSNLGGILKECVQCQIGLCGDRVHRAAEILLHLIGGPVCCGNAQEMVGIMTSRSEEKNIWVL